LDDSKGLWKGYQGEIGDFRKITLQDDKDSGRQRFRKIKLLQRKVKLKDLTTHLEQLSLWLQTKVMGGSSEGKASV
jgi:hypothetical protein